MTDATWFATGAVIAALVFVVVQHLGLLQVKTKVRVLRYIIRSIAEGKSQATVNKDNDVIIEEKR